MGDKTGIAWTHKTFNPWWGCTKVSPGCTHCYAEALAHRFRGMEWGKGKQRILSRDSYWNQLQKWNKQAEGQESPTLVFTGSMCDVFDDEVPAEWQARLLEECHACKNLTFQFLTKRPDQWQSLCLEIACLRGEGARLAHQWLQGKPPCDLWMGASAENQEYYDRRIDWLRDIPADYNFLSIEPLLGPIKLKIHKPVDWIILGGESGGKARECHVDLIKSLLLQADYQGIRCFVKQMGAAPVQTVNGSKFPLTLLDPAGANPVEWPPWARLQEFPYDEIQHGRTLLGSGPQAGPQVQCEEDDG